jgi:dTDP-4-amino-4,6-dideoxygalactose transaminase
MPARMDEIMEISCRYGIPVIEDAAEALGSRYKGRHPGTDGLMGILSFNGNKIITTTGGGMLVSKSRELIEKARFLSTQARDEAPHYEHSQMGFNYRMSNLLAGVGLGQLAVLQERVRARRRNFRKYQHYFRELKMRGFHVRMCHEPAEFFSNRWLTVILVDPGCCQGVTREKLRLAFGKARIETRPMWKPMHLQPLFREAPCYGGRISERLFDQGLCLPSGSALTAGDFERITRVMNTVFRAPVTGKSAFRRREPLRIVGSVGPAAS